MASREEMVVVKEKKQVYKNKNNNHRIFCNNLQQVQRNL